MAVMPMAAVGMVPVRSLSADSPVKQREDSNFPSNSFERGSKPWLERPLVSVTLADVAI